jgi:hypothetical protein
MFARIGFRMCAVAAAALSFSACGGAGAGLGPQPGTPVQGAAYVPQSSGALAANAALPGGRALSTQAFPQPLPEPLIDLGHGVSPDITAPIINDSGTYLNGPIILASNHATAGYGVEGLAYGSGAGLYGQVMITPDGDTRGLYVASKTATAFVVREVQGGRGSFAFDYHIYATTLGHARERMGLVSGSDLAIPHAPAVRVDLTRPAVRLPEKPH